MSNDVCCSEAAYPPESNLKLCYKPQPRDLTDTEKAIYLKLVELAKAGKIKWDARNGGNFAGYRVWCYDNPGSGATIVLSTVITGDSPKLDETVITFGIDGEQAAGDLRAIASEQYDARLKELQTEFLQA